ncbi:hypothetical protein [Methylocaldum sp.]|uniref:hypothetical protein n=1 Tax=Methylocaldum sp. TaxID=1969727 RepID=UPI002D7412B5|nr:hypothetical protein [Methylocaldum sp.]HYE38150.1 hypothetical protein [Methylocaldum sp.]
MKNPLIVVGIPSGPDWKADFALSVVGLVAAATRPLIGGGRIEMLRIHNTKGSILPKSREMLVKLAQKEGATHLLFVDSDQTFPAYLLHQLLRHDKDIIAANCVTKVIPANPTARQFSETEFAGTLVDSREKSGIEKVWRVGTGVMLIKMSVFDRIAQPWFPITWNESLQDYTGEDWNFCQSCQEAGIDIWIDHDVSKQIGHIGVLTYDISHQGDSNE